MAASGTDPIPAVSEQDATGETAALYDDLRVTLSVPFVNLIWRHFATIPQALPWTWTRLKPLYTSGELERLSADTASRIAFPSLAPLPECVWESAGIPHDQRQVIAAMIDDYNRANGMNFLAMHVALSALRNDEPDAARGRGAAQATSSARAPANLPPLPALSELPPHVLALVRGLDRFGRLGESEAIASLYRHLAHWPAFLALAYTALEPLQRRGAFDAAQTEIAGFARSQNAYLAGLMDRDTIDIPPESRIAVQRALDEFTRLMIGRMIVMGAALRSLLPVPVNA